jgi:hypothetical protein
MGLMGERVGQPDTQLIRFDELGALDADEYLAARVGRAADADLGNDVAYLDIDDPPQPGK